MVGSIGGLVLVIRAELAAAAAIADDLLLSLSLVSAVSLKWSAANINFEKLIPFPEKVVGLDESSLLFVGL